MNKFISRLFLFLITLGVFLSPLVFLKIGGQNLNLIDNPTALIIDKNNRIEKLQSPKLIILGGSNAFYGMNSGKLESDLGINVVNMTLFAGFGLDFILRQTLDNVSKGDVVILSIEYYLKSDCNPRAKEEILRYYPSASKYFGNSQVSILKKYKNSLANNIESIQNLILTPIKRTSSNYIHSRTINKYGDAIGYLRFVNPRPRAPFGKITYKYYDGIKKLNKYAKKKKKKGVAVYFIFPPLAFSDYKKNEGTIEKYYEDLINNLDIPLLCTPSEMVFEDDLFFDTAYHLDRKGREIRTNRLIKYYRKAQPTSDSQYGRVR